MNQRIAFCFLILCAGFVVREATSGPIIRRHDRGEDAYLDLGRRYGGSVCDVLGASGRVRAGGTLIGPRWVLTAAHVAQGTHPGQTVRVGGDEVLVEAVYVHPQWEGPAHDIGLLHLERPVEGTTPVPLYRANDEAGRTLIVVGRGMSGTGLTGPTGEDGRLRGGTNRVDGADPTALRFAFDAPGTPGVTDLEGVSGPGDSGGPGLIEADGVVYVAGVSSGQDHAGGQPGRYGVTEYYTRVSTHAAWIEGTIRASETAVVRGDLGAELDAYMTRLERLGFSGGLLVASDGAVVLSKGYGMADRAREIPFTNETVFPVGSITKSFTGAAMLKLEMLGKVHVEDPITTYFDDVPADKAGITLHHLLTHSAGLPDALGFDFAPIEREAYVAQALAAELLFEPGTAYAYSNVGYSLLAAVVERVTGRSYDAFVQEYLFRPAGLTQTGYVFSRWEPDRLAHGYRGDEDGGTFADHPWAADGPYWHLRGNGGLLSTLDDLYRWHIALEGDDVLSAEARAKYYTPYVREGDNAPSYYGYGWVIEETRRGTLITHNGGNPYFSNDFLRYVDADVVIYLTSNTSDHRAPQISGTIADIVFGDPYDLPPESVETLTEADLAELPLGRRALALLAAVATPDEAAARRFIEEHLDPAILERNSMDDLVGEFARDQAQIGAVEIGRIRRTGEHELELTVRSKATGAWWLYRITGTAEPPYRIRGVGVMDTMPPPGVAGPTPTVGAPQDPGWGLPDSPTGRAASAFLDAVTQADAAVHRRFIEDHFVPAFRDQFPMEEHLAIFNQMHETLVDAEVVDAVKRGPHAVRLTVRSKTAGEQLIVDIDLEPQPPHRIEGIQVAPVE